MEKKYQIFISSTYKDLIEARIPACHSLMKYEKAEVANTQKSSGLTGERTAKVWRGARCCWRWAM